MLKSNNCSKVHLHKGPNSETIRNITKIEISDEAGEDTSETLQYFMHSLSNFSPGDPELAKNLNLIHGLFDSKYLTTQDLGSVLKYEEAAVNALPAKLPFWHQRLATVYSKRYYRTGNVQNLEAAFHCQLLAITATPADHPADEEIFVKSILPPTRPLIVPLPILDSTTCKLNLIYQP